MSRFHLVDPIAPHSVGSQADGPSSDAGSGAVALADTMLNPGSGWGAGILDAVASTLHRRDRSTTIERIRRDHGITAPEPGAWAAAMASIYRAIVIAAGD